MNRSPYLEAKVNRWSEDKKELIVEDCDLVTFNILVDYMYDIKIPEPVICQDSLNKLLEMSDKWQMDDLKASVQEAITRDLFNALPFSDLSDKTEGMFASTENLKKRKRSWMVSQASRKRIKMSTEAL